MIEFGIVVLGLIWLLLTVGIPIALITLCWFIPTYIAVGNGRSDSLWIACLNLLVGWLPIFWIMLFIWALRVEGKIYEH